MISCAVYRLALLGAALTLGACASAPPAPPAQTAGLAAAAPPAAEASGPSAAPSVLTAAVPAAAAEASGPVGPIAIDPLEPTARIALGDAAAEADLWERVRVGLALPDLDNDRVRKWEQWYAARPDYVQRMTERGGRYLYHILEEVERRGMPTELALLPFIESAYNPQAQSRAKASGMWQFVPGTGRDFSLRQNVFRDDRRDVLASTRAALDYLRTLHAMFDDWQLALAAYNWGQGNVQRAIARNQRAGLPTDYDSLRMPDETRNYLPKLQAVKNIVLRPDDFALALPPLRNHPYFISVAIDRDIDIERAAALAGLPLDEFKQLNPQMNKPLILAACTPQVLLPYDNASQFVSALMAHGGPLASWTAWVAPRTLKPAEAARLVGMDEAALREVNDIPPRMLVKAGSTLLVPRGAHLTDDVAGHIADNATLALAPDVPPLRRLRFKAGSHGESVAMVAQRHGVSPAQVAQWNNTSVGARFKPGQQITVLVANRGTAAPRATAAAPAAARPLANASTKARPAVRVAGGGTTGKPLRKPGPAARSAAPVRR